MAFGVVDGSNRSSRNFRLSDKGLRRSFYKRRLQVGADVDGRRVVYQSPSLEDCLQTFISPDRDDREAVLARTRLPASFSRLLMSYCNTKAWACLGSALVTFLRQQGLGFDAQFFLHLSANEHVEDLPTSVISLSTCRIPAQRFLRFATQLLPLLDGRGLTQFHDVAEFQHYFPTLLSILGLDTTAFFHLENHL